LRFKSGFLILPEKARSLLPAIHASMSRLADTQGKCTFFDGVHEFPMQMEHQATVQAARLPPYLLLSFSSKMGSAPDARVALPLVGLDVGPLTHSLPVDGADSGVPTPEPVLYDLVGAIHRVGAADGTHGNAHTVALCLPAANDSVCPFRAALFFSPNWVFVCRPLHCSCKAHCQRLCQVDTF